MSQSHPQPVMFQIMHATMRRKRAHAGQQSTPQPHTHMPQKSIFFYRLHHDSRTGYVPGSRATAFIVQHANRDHLRKERDKTKKKYELAVDVEDWALATGATLPVPATATC